ncbi:LysM peptidoglycan-binding domain-containing protein [Vibrio kanaloae]|uniref:LysM domain-containing protein n=1 Tax=Vibrio sp. FF_307 TaxID=1652834 RepID=A0A0H4A2Z3_9VIBR|nr:LysM domain-containing protein [Vibrio kanaloae]AKN40594.1 hypothetical protein [Vibrio sp. FF_307]TKE89528.1 LysM peptidoglycan-binding domain-containing protein [Vibrio kanaloae]TKF12346.1 LysM peptidoglycan-binding domain-containing protein [Vibrio kanaloae]TKF74079.1 LysM peptidoglycan-binding domain-containing protein [Vibrio kanaloae]
MSVYTIQPGDALLQIAINQGVEYVDLLTLNPQCQNDPDHIIEGETLTLPNAVEIEDSAPDYSIESPSENIEPTPSGEIESSPDCQGVEVHDVLFLTGDAPTDYYCLSEEHQAKLKEEIAVTDALIQDYKTLLEEAPHGDDIAPEVMKEHALKKKSWLEQCVYAGAISVNEPTPTVGVAAGAQSTPITQDYINSKITELNKRRNIVESYVPFFTPDSEITLRKETLNKLEEEMAYWTKLMTSTSPPEAAERSNGQKVDLDTFNAKTMERTPARRHVVEAWLVSENRLVYLRVAFLEQARTFWIKNPVSSDASKALKARDWSGLKNAFINDIKRGVQKDMGAGKLENIFQRWEAEGWKAHEWKATQKLYDENGEAIFATTQEAQLLRFAAQASVSNTLNISEGKVDIGVSAQASFALAEGAVGFERYLPYESGYPLGLSYLDANKKPAVYPFGQFRAKLSLVLSCFAGSMVNGRLALSNQVNSNPGHQVLLSPTVTMGTNASGGVGIKGDIFGGAQVGGQVEGGFEWKAPPDITQDKVFDFATLAKVSADGNVAIGAGASWDFQLSLDRGKFYFNCSGRLVWGPGGGGGFGSVIDAEQLWQLAVILFKGLKATDYRVLDNLDGDAYTHFIRSSYYAFVLTTRPEDALKQAVMSTYASIDTWWRARLDLWKNDSEKRKEAQRLARRINQSLTRKGCTVTGEVAFDELLPETVGIMLNTLVTTFYLSWEEQQEKAIRILLLGAVKTWRRFEEVLARMNATGEKDQGDEVLFHNLARINAILDGAQQSEFDRWVFKLAQHKEITADNLHEMRPFTPRSGNAWHTKKPTVEQQIAQLNQYNGQYTV